MTKPNGQAQTEVYSNLRQWPTLGDAALLNLAGEIVGTIEEVTECDRVALLLQLLAGFGSIVGRNAHFAVGAVKHFLILFILFVGVSSKGRKDTARAEVDSFLTNIDPSWRRKGGLSSAEGVVSLVRDPSGDDPGVVDKRILIRENEFLTVLKAMERIGNPLSAVLRDAWDGNDLCNLTTTPRVATAPHISLAANITAFELRKNLPETEMLNGFLNRFLLAAVRRSKLMPEPGQIATNKRNALHKKLAAAVHAGKAVGEMVRDDGARRLWYDTYPALSEPGFGLLGSITSRAEAQVTRLSCIYALLDNCGIVRRQHLESALALWDYCAKSCEYIFGSALSDPLANRIRELIDNAGEQGISRTEISNKLHRDYSKARIDAALSELAEYGYGCHLVPRANGAPIEVWTRLGGNNGEVNS